jgi:hypothetical protein
MRLMSDVWGGKSRRCSVVRFRRLLAMLSSAALSAACGGDTDQGALTGDSVPQATSQQATPQQATLPQTLCNLLPRADAERVMGKALVEQRNDGSACHYRDAVGTTGTGVMLNLNAFQVSDQCRLIPDSEPLSGVGSQACIAIGRPAGLYTTLVFEGGGRTFEVTAPGEDRASELATAVAKVVLSKLGS